MTNSFALSMFTEELPASALEPSAAFSVTAAAVVSAAAVVDVLPELLPLNPENLKRELAL